MTVSYTVKINIDQIAEFVEFFDEYQEGRDYTLAPVPHPHRVAVEKMIRGRWAMGMASSPVLNLKLNTVTQWSEDEVEVTWKCVAGATAFKLRFMDDLGFRSEPKPLTTIPQSLRVLMGKGEA